MRLISGIIAVEEKGRVARVGKFILVAMTRRIKQRELMIWQL
jgi:hypothetical protein